MRTGFNVLIAVSSIFLLSSLVYAQGTCLTTGDVKSMLTRVISEQPKLPPNKTLRNDLLNLKIKTEDTFQDVVPGASETQETYRRRVRRTAEKNGEQLCKILTEFGWPTTTQVGADGVAALLYVLKNAPLELQRDLAVVAAAAVEKGQVQNQDFAELFDRMHINAGEKQVFGTQAYVSDGFLVLYPMDGEARIDERRQRFGLTPLSEELLTLQRTYQKPLLRPPDAPLDGTAWNQKQVLTGQEISPEDVLRVDTNLVNMSVCVFSNKLKAYVDSLAKNDFKIVEDGHEEALTYFAAADVPFDLVLLIDLSGSTANKRELIRKTTQRFIEAARPGDRVAIVSFADTTTVVSPLTEDRAALLESANKIDGDGGSHVWDALKFTLDVVVGPRTMARRRAVVLMSDGVDNALLFSGVHGSKTSFADLLDTVRQTDVLVVPIYLDTEPNVSFGLTKTLYENARKTLELVAEESGGSYYKARKVSDLNGVYQQVINDLAKFYSVGYRPSNGKRDGRWRRVKIQIANRPDLLARTRPGYYAK